MTQYRVVLPAIRLDVLSAQDRGWYRDAHRAQAHGLALLQVLNRPVGSDARTALMRWQDAATALRFKLRATGSTSASKDRLTERGHRWGSEASLWTCM